MAATRPILSFVSLIVLAGGIVMSFFVVLSGSTNSSPEQYIYFLQASTNGINGYEVRNPARWTFLAICGENNGNNANCRSTTPALPFDPPRNFQTNNNMPSAFIGTHHYFYLSRFMFAFYLIALFFGIVAFFTGALALCTRLGAYLSGLMVSIALFFQILAASLMTAWTYQGRRAFRRNGQDAKLGTYAYAFTWTAMVCYLICTVLFCVGGSVGKDKGYSGGGGGSKKSGGYFGRKRSTRSRGSFIDTESQRRVKDEYDGVPSLPSER